ncbi:MAG TPA: lysophospholipid acyltransferase family protein [Candidatus Aquicultor sp.]|jgi:1-acyl-sn-glycerol-3-phosphate acyltransferase
MFYKLVCALLALYMKPAYRYEITGKENIPKKGPVILAANHMSYFDPIMIAFVGKPRPVNFMAKAELIKIPLLGRALKALHTFPVKRGLADKGAISYALKVLADGEVLLIFPEGTRHRDGKLGEPFSGVTSMALKTGTPIVPVGIIGTDKVKPKGSKLLKFPKIKAHIGEPIMVEKASAAERKAREAELAAQMMNEIKNLISGER